MDREQLRRQIESLVREAVSQVASGVGPPVVPAVSPAARPVPIGVSNRHLHLQPDHVDRLYGKGHRLRNMRDLLQPGQFACVETVTLIGPNGRIADVRVLGPERPKTQIEMTVTDGYELGIAAPVKLSGDLAGSAGVKMLGPRGSVDLKEGLIVAERHLHIHTDEARAYGLKDRTVIAIRTRGSRPVVFENVAVRVSDRYKLEFHLDTDEANAAGVKHGDIADIV